MKKKVLKDHMTIKTRALDGGISVGGFKSAQPMARGVLYEKLDDGYGNDILKKVGENTVVIGGALTALEHLCGTAANWKPKSLNEIYEINADKDDPTSIQDTCICLFGVGIGGSGMDFTSVNKKDTKLRDVPTLIPLRRTDDISSGDDADKYFFKKETDTVGVYDYYLKEFDAPIEIKPLWKDSLDEDVDGTEITEDISTSERTENQETYAAFQISFNTSDVREYFEQIGEIDLARYNSLGLFLGRKVELEDGTFDYADVRLFCYLNFHNKSVTNKTASKYEYRIYTMV